MGAGALFVSEDALQVIHGNAMRIACRQEHIQSSLPDASTLIRVLSRSMLFVLGVLPEYMWRGLTYQDINPGFWFLFTTFGRDVCCNKSPTLVPLINEYLHLRFWLLANLI